MSRIILSFYFIFILLSFPFSTSMNFNTGLINIPIAETLEQLGYDLGVTASRTLGKETELIDPRFSVEEDGRFNLGIQFQSQTILKYNFEIGITQFTLIEDKNRHDAVVNFRWQLIKEPADTDWAQDIDLDTNPAMRYLPSIAFGIKNIVGNGMQYITSVGPQQELPNAKEYRLEKHKTNNSYYLAFTKKLLSLPEGKLQLHWGWGSNSFRGEISPKDKSVGLFGGVSYTFKLAGGLNPLTIMADYDGKKAGIGLVWVYNNRELMKKILKGEAVDRFIPGIRVAFAISDIEESFRDYREETYNGLKMAPNIEFHLGITNDAYLKYKNYYSKAGITPEELRRKKYAEAMRAKAMAEAAKARAMAAAAKAKAKEKKPEELANELKAIGMTVRESATEFIVILNKVTFSGRTTNFAPGATDILDKVVSILNNYPEIKGRIEGHTDSLGPDAANLKLSDDRAQTVRQYLISKGISADRFVAKGMGETKPIASNDTVEGREKNRRIELIFSK